MGSAAKPVSDRPQMATAWLDATSCEGDAWGGGGRREEGGGGGGGGGGRIGGRMRGAWVSRNCWARARARSRFPFFYAPGSAGRGARVGEREQRQVVGGESRRGRFEKHATAPSFTFFSAPLSLSQLISTPHHGFRRGRPRPCAAGGAGDAAPDCRWPDAPRGGGSGEEEERTAMLMRLSRLCGVCVQVRAGARTWTVFSTTQLAYYASVYAYAWVGWWIKSHTTWP